MTTGTGLRGMRRMILRSCTSGMSSLRRVRVRTWYHSSSHMLPIQQWRRRSVLLLLLLLPLGATAGCYCWLLLVAASFVLYC